MNTRILEKHWETGSILSKVAGCGATLLLKMNPHKCVSIIPIISIDKLHNRAADLSVEHFSKIVSNDSESLMVEIVNMYKYRSLK